MPQELPQAPGKAQDREEKTKATRDHSGYLARDTIAAVSTALGGALGVVRLSGPQALFAVEKLTRASGKLRPRALTRRKIFKASGVLLDDAMVVFFPTPHSFTGEDVIELHIHGSAHIASTLLNELFEYGIRQALPGEFSFRAVRNAKMDLTQAEALAELIQAQNENAALLALEKLSGTQSRLIQELREGLRSLAAFAEVGIDFSDQDVEEFHLSKLKSSLNSHRQTLKNLQASFQAGRRMQAGVSVALMGLPNAGKSSFFNALLGEDRSIVSEIPGTTRDLIRETVTLSAKHSSITFRLADTAGLHPSQDQVENLGMDRTRSAARSADLILWVVDPTGELEEAVAMWRALDLVPEKAIGVFSKVDLVDSEDKIKALRCQLTSISHAPGVWISTSALRGQGIAEVAGEMVSRWEGQLTRPPGDLWLTREDHYQAVVEALSHIDRALDSEEVDLFAADLRHVLRALAPLIGQTMADDLLAKIFSEFCIGK